MRYSRDFRARQPGGRARFSPRWLFSAGQYGIWIDPSDLGTLYQDSAGTVPVTAAGQPVKLALDKSGNGNHLSLNGTILALDADNRYALYMSGTGYGVTNTLALSAYSEATFAAGYKVDNTSAMCIAELSTGVSGVGVSGAFSIFQGITKAGPAGADKTKFSLRTSNLLRNDASSVQPGTKLSANLTVNSSATTAANQLKARINGVEIIGGHYGTPAAAPSLGNYPLYIGARGAASLRFSGHIYAIILRAGAVSERTRADIDRYVVDSMSYKSPPAPEPVPNPTVVDLFITAGQSNSEGRGTASESPSVADGTAWLLSGGAFTKLADPVGGASTGSAWPSFANKWKELTGRSSVWVEQATGGSALIPAAGPTNWSQTGTLYPACVSAANAAVSTINANPAFALGNVYICWAQGEQEGLNYNGTTISASVYQAAQTELFNGFKSGIPSLSKIFVSALGRLTNGTYEQQHTLIRDAQAASISSIPHAHIVFSGAVNFVPANMKDNVHYNQTGYNEMGVGMAQGAASVVYP